MMDGASWIRAHRLHGADAAAFSDDGLGGELAHLVLRPLGIVLAGRLVNLGVLVAWEYGAVFLLRPVCRADLHNLRSRGDGLGDMRRDFGLIASRVAARILLAEVGEQ